jgi:hypothetical protein
MAMGLKSHCNLPPINHETGRTRTVTGDIGNQGEKQKKPEKISSPAFY